MKKENNILMSNMLVLGLGILMAFAIVFTPVLKNHLPQEGVTVEQTQSDDEKEQERQETQVSTFDAVTSVIQLNLIPDQEITAVLEVEHVDEISLTDEITKEFPRKLFSILFRRIISPNAP